MLGFVLFIIVLGIAFNLAIGYGPAGMVLAVLVAGGMAFASYWKSDSIALAVSRAFSVAVIDALIFADQDLYQSEGFLDNYVDMFMGENARLRAITILDPAGEVVGEGAEGVRAARHGEEAVGRHGEGRARRMRRGVRRRRQGAQRARRRQV